MGYTDYCIDAEKEMDENRLNWLHSTGGKVDDGRRRRPDKIDGLIVN